MLSRTVIASLSAGHYGSLIDDWVVASHLQLITAAASTIAANSQPAHPARLVQHLAMYVLRPRPFACWPVSPSPKCLSPGPAAAMHQPSGSGAPDAHHKVLQAGYAPTDTYLPRRRTRVLRCSRYFFRDLACHPKRASSSFILTTQIVDFIQRVARQPLKYTKSTWMNSTN